MSEIEKALAELKALMKYRESQLGHKEDFRGLGLTSRKNLCLHPSVKREKSGAVVDARCRSLTAGFVKEKKEREKKDKKEKGMVYNKASGETWFVPREERVAAEEKEYQVRNEKIITNLEAINKRVQEAEVHAPGSAGHINLLRQYLEQLDMKIASDTDAKSRMSMHTIKTLEETNEYYREYISQLEKINEVKELRIAALERVNRTLKEMLERPARSPPS
jgi:hypothetical protein